MFGYILIKMSWTINVYVKTKGLVNECPSLRFLIKKLFFKKVKNSNFQCIDFINFDKNLLFKVTKQCSKVTCYFPKTNSRIKKYKTSSRINLT